MVQALSQTPAGERPHIVILGRRNVGKSSLINALAGQQVALVSDVPGTTTDPVSKAMEISPIGPVVLVDTAGLDDEGYLGELRVQRTKQVLATADLALLVLEAGQSWGLYEEQALSLLDQHEVPVVAVITKADLRDPAPLRAEVERRGLPVYAVSSATGQGVWDLRQSLHRHLLVEQGPPLIGDLLQKGDVVVLVVPIDLGAPKGRLILPQVQVIRECLDREAAAYVVKEHHLREALLTLRVKPRLVVTDSQAVAKVHRDVPPDITFTTFSILFARYKGDLPTFVRGLGAVQSLRPGDRVLIAEACTHHPSPDDIGRVKIPRWLREHLGGDVQIDMAVGKDFPEDLSPYRLVVHCGGCMVTRKTVRSRLRRIAQQGVPVVNYGVLISYLHGALPRALEPFPEALAVWETLKSVREVCRS
ncbi:MAG: [FeFe] hydrogenase H-cluster maturation GTPase HydF [candidate division KSB1 bacterium]|nr:[FeFe] hydrogenase H-cluster maturation GTPase HydF [candidate division KSB1 bacterium]